MLQAENQSLRTELEAAKAAQNGSSSGHPPVKRSATASESARPITPVASKLVKKEDSRKPNKVYDAFDDFEY